MYIIVSYDCGIQWSKYGNPAVRQVYKLIKDKY